MGDLSRSWAGEGTLKGSDQTYVKMMHTLGKKWTVAIMETLSSSFEVGASFNELQYAINGICPRILSETLKELNSEALITRLVEKQGKLLRTEYALTEKGKKVTAVLRHFRELEIA